MQQAEPNIRRPLKSRNTAWARAAATYLATRGVRPNQVSLASILMALIAATFCVLAPNVGSLLIRGLCLVAAAISVQLRLLCNLLDGMLAVEGGMQSPEGEFYNEFPDRVSDLLILWGFALALPATPVTIAFGAGSSSLALLSAYVRTLRASLTGVQDFGGPMAKPHRMALVTCALLLAAIMPEYSLSLLYTANVLLLVGTALTVTLRSQRLLQALREK